MNHLKSLYFLIISLVIFSINLEAKDERPHLKGPYLGQKPPGLESKNFVDPIDMQTLEKAKIIARRIMIIDCHSHNLFQPGSTDKPKQVSFSMLKQSGVNGIVQSFPLDFKAINNPSEDILKNIIDTKNKIKKESLNISVALKSSDFFSPNSDDSFPMMLGIEYFKGIFGGNIKMLEKYHEEGVRVIGIVRTGGMDNIYVNDNLTEFGSELIGEMNRLGIICDITHLTESAQTKIIEASQAPVILSHTNAYSVVNSGFNVTDTTLEKLTAKGGIICVTFFSGQLSRRALNYLKEKKNLNQLPRANIEELVDQIDYLKKKVGIDYIGIGSDYGGSGRMSPEGLETIEGFPMIIYHMLKRNYSKNEIEKVMGLNFIHFYERVENKAELQKGNVNTQQDDWPVLKGPYLGQKPPGMKPEVFAPGILNTDKMGAFCTVFSPDGKEFYFVYYKRVKDTPGGLACMRKVNDVWKKPEILPFNSPTYDNDMCISPDGNKLIFRSWRSLPNGSKPRDHSYLWFSERTKNSWSEAKPLLCAGKPVRTGYPSISNNGTLYFAFRGEKGVGVYRSVLKNNTYIAPEHVYTVLDSIETEGDMFVAPDESYMIISCWDHPGNIGGRQGDLYIVFKKKNELWTMAINMGEGINTQYGENCPQVSPDGKYFFFNRYNPDIKKGNMYWMDAKIIEELKPKDMK